MNLDRLLSEGKVTENYLQDWNGSEYPEGQDNHPVTNISHFAAAAFCDWLTAKLPRAMSDYEIRLPLEEEWEWACLGGNQSPTGQGVFGMNEGPRPAAYGAPNEFGLKNMLGNVWEWCEDWYLPNKNLLVRSFPENPQTSPIEVDAGAERVVKGGSWANNEEDINHYMRGSQPPHWCTPYLGMRVVAGRIR
jgi:formylglycine-generating enzyme required for sulfatase activity